MHVQAIHRACMHVCDDLGQDASIYIYRVPLHVLRPRRYDDAIQHQFHRDSGGKIKWSRAVALGAGAWRWSWLPLEY